MPKSIYILFLLCALSAKADAQSLSQNYVLGKLMFDKGFSRKDWNLAVEHVNLPYFIIHTDGGIYGGVNKNGKMKSWENYPMADFEDIKNGVLSLFSLVQELLK